MLPSQSLSSGSSGYLSLEASCASQPSSSSQERAALAASSVLSSTEPLSCKSISLVLKEIAESSSNFDKLDADSKAFIEQYIKINFPEGEMTVGLTESARILYKIYQDSKKVPLPASSTLSSNELLSSKSNSLALNKMPEPGSDFDKLNPDAKAFIEQYIKIYYPEGEKTPGLTEEARILYKHYQDLKKN